MEAAEIDHAVGAITGFLLELADRRGRRLFALALVADEAIHSKVEPEIWGEAMTVLVEHVKDGRPGEGMALAVEKIGGVCAGCLPKTLDDPNQIADRLIEI